MPFIGVQVLVQAVGALSGLLVVRFLVKEDYALFTIANTMLGMMAVLSDNGITSGLMAIGGRVHADRFRFGQVVTTASALRRKFGGFVLIPIVPLSFWLLYRNGASLGMLVALVVVVLASFWLQMEVGILQVVPRLALQTKRVQYLDLAGALLRLGLLIAAVGVYLNPAVAVFIAGCGTLVQLWMLRRWGGELLDVGAPESPTDRQEILKIVKRQAPNALYYCIQSQLTIWLISIFGSTENIADVGALGRLAVLFAVAGAVMNAIVMPRFSRCQDAHIIGQLYGKICLGLGSVGATLFLFSLLFPNQLLWLLGAQYTGLNEELVLSVLGSVLTSIGGAMYGLNTSRGWIVSPLLAISAGVIWQIILIASLDISSVKGVLLMTIGMAPLSILLCAMTAWRGIASFRQSASAS